MVFTSLVLIEESLGADGFWLLAGVSLLWSRCAGVRGLSYRKSSRGSAAFVLADACGWIKVGAGVVG